MSNTIGTLNEKSLHAALKTWYTRPGDQLEVSVDGFVIDIVRGDLLVEIQTRSFSAMKRKLHKLTVNHPVRLVHPVAQEKWIIKLDKMGQIEESRRKSPKRGAIEQLFAELVSFPKLLADANFSLEVLLVQEEELRQQTGVRAWRRRGWSTQERRLLSVVSQTRFETPADLMRLLPSTLPEPFTTADLAAAIDRPRGLAQKMAYCLRELALIEPVSRTGKGVLYRKKDILHD